jgi:hypothetical protein
MIIPPSGILQDSVFGVLTMIKPTSQGTVIANSGLSPWWLTYRDYNPVDPDIFTGEVILLEAGIYSMYLNLPDISNDRTDLQTICLINEQYQDFPNRDFASAIYGRIVFTGIELPYSTKIRIGAEIVQQTPLGRVFYPYGFVGNPNTVTITLIKG